MKLKWQTILRLFLTALILIGVWIEAGTFTALAITLLTLSMELVGYILAMVAMEKLNLLNSFAESLLKNTDSDNV